MTMFRLASLIALLAAWTSSLAFSAVEAPSGKPVNLTCNTEADEDDPHISSNGLTLYYSSNATNKWTVMFSKHQPSGKWGSGKAVEGYIGPPPDAKKPPDYRGVFLTPDGSYPQFMYFASNKNENDQKGDNFDLFVTYRNAAKDEFVPPEMVTVDTAADELNPWLVKDSKSLMLYFDRKTKDGFRVFKAACNSPKGGQNFAEPALVEELAPDFHHVALTPDGLTMYMEGPLEKGRSGLFVAKKVAKNWGKPEPLDQMNDPSGPTGDHSPSLNRTGTTLYFSSDRDGGKGGLDLYSINTADLKKN